MWKKNFFFKRTQNNLVDPQFFLSVSQVKHNVTQILVTALETKTLKNSDAY